ncbi:MAG: hypothetical protein K0S09_2304 [Sphingobacteriaceae bacterium]|jgi:hypothetical protein|nr:hypothetical protein [Sphingobacteriaceae bacterium]
MERRLLLVITFFFLAATTYSQTFSVKGIVTDSAGLRLPSASVKLFFEKDSLTTLSGLNGTFKFDNVRAAQFTLQAAFIGFEKFVKTFSAPAGAELDVQEIRLKEAPNVLGEVTITGIIPVKVKEDTVEYSAAAYKVREGDGVDEMLKKLPGVMVDRDGNVTVQGKPLTQLRINGKDFHGSDVAAAIQNLPADIIQNLQFIDDYGDQAKLTGIKSGDPKKVLNINIQPDKKRGYTLQSTGGLGNESRYVATLRGNSFKDDRQLSFNGSLNNTNIKGGGGDGITDAQSASFNYRNNWGKRVESYGGLNYNGRSNNTLSKSLRQNVYQTFTRYEDNNSDNNSRYDAGQFFWNFEYQLDSLNYIKFSPSITQNHSSSHNSGTAFITQKTTTSLRDSKLSNSTSSGVYSGNLLLNHKFMRRGRNLSVYTTFSVSQSDNNRDMQNNYLNTDSKGVVKNIDQYQLNGNENNNNRIILNASYREPLSKTSFLELSYNWNRTDTRAGRNIRDVDAVTGAETFNPALSNDFQYQFVTNKYGLNYRKYNAKYNYILGIGVQPGVLKGEDLSRDVVTEKRTFNWVPTARFVYKLSKQKTFTANYNGKSVQPSFSQIQPISNTTNLQNTVTGNPDLKPEFNQTVTFDYNESDIQAGRMFFAGASASQVSNRIVTRKMLLADTFNQVTTYQNTNGFYNLKGNYSFSQPFHERMFTATYYGNANFSNNIAYTNNERNVGKNLVLKQGLKFRVDIKNHVDAEFEASYAINKTNYTAENFIDRRTNTLNVGISGRSFFFKDLTLGYDVLKSINSGYSYANKTNPFIINSYLEYRFMKGNKGSVRVHGFDLLNQNNGIERDVFDNVIVDSQTNRLSRYFLMSFNLNINKFGGKKNQASVRDKPSR